jgi:nitrite reductase (cytochrome c-552)
MRNIAMDALVDLITQIESAKAAGRSDAQLEPARGYQRKAQFLLDFIESENSSGFHAPQEAARILVKSVDYSRRGQSALTAPPIR